MIRVAAAAVGAASLALFALTFAPWFKHQYYGTPRERFLENPDGLYLRLNGWQLYDTELLAASILLAVFAGLGAAAWLVRRGGGRGGVVVGVFGLLTALAALVRIADELRAPSDSNYPHPVWGIYVALAASAALIVASVAATLVAARTGASRQNVQPVLPVVAGAAVVYTLTLIAVEGELWIPEAIVVFPLAGAVAYAAGRWWIALLPPGAGFLYAQAIDVEGLGAIVLVLVVLMATAAAIAGVVAKVVQRRLAAARPPIP